MSNDSDMGQLSISNTYDPRTISWTLISPPWHMAAIITIYFIFVIRVGPRLMANRKPLKLRNLMLIYNSTMVLVNSFFFLAAIKWLDYGKALLKFELPSADNTSDEEMWHLHLFYYYYMSKFLDLADTVFFVLRKKQRQITTLHLYHHTVVPILMWMAMWMRCTAPGVSLFVFLNSAVHVIMYTYYALSALGPEVQKYLWWKRYITQVQLAQFLVLVVYVLTFGRHLTGYPPEAFWFGAVQPPLFFYMFFDFYRKSYRKKPAAKESEKAK